MTENNSTAGTQQETDRPSSQSVAGIRFRNCGKVYTFDVDNIDVVPGSKVVVDSEMGLSLGRVVTSRQIIEKTREPLKKVLRIATEKDFETARENRSLENEARQFCIEKVKELNLPMKIVTTETTLDKKKLVFYFTADGRIDFRELVRDLASKFKTRIEMRQIGVRDEVKLLGGFGCCGRQTCCSLFLTSFEPITIKMAKEQDLSINQSKLSGICGRLMCCLGYEYRETGSEEQGALSKEESLVSVSEDTSERGLQKGVGDIVAEVMGPGEAEKSEGHPCAAEENIKDVQSQREKPLEQPAEEKRRFKRDRRRRRRRPDKASPAGVEGKKQEERPHDKTDQSESKKQGRPSKRRRRHWKKKKQAENGSETIK